MVTPPLIVLCSDFGGGPFVGLMKGVILGICPQALLVDLAHDIPPQDVRAGALVLEQALSVFPAGTIHLAVVDPGVGGQRRAILVEALNQFFVGPDNGIFTPVLLADSQARVWELNNPAFFRHPLSATFHGRDIFAPVAAHLAWGLSPGELGSPAREPVLLDWPLPFRRGDTLVGQVLGADRFGNLQTNLSRAQVEGFLAGRPAQVSLAGLVVKGLSQTYAQAAPGGLVALFNSLDRLELAQNLGDARRAMGLEAGRELGLEVVVAALA